jgi:thioredoxin-related protein
MVPLSKLIDTLGKAQGGRIVVAGLLTSEGCPWCVALKKEQLLPRSRAQMAPGFLVVEMDVDDASPAWFPDGKKRTAREWGNLHGMRLTPTLAMLDARANPLTPPLVGYASRDFYASYLEDQIRIARAYWQNRTS